MAFEPINYLAMVPQQDFLRDIQGGLQLGAGYREAQRISDARALELQQKQIAMRQAAQYQADTQAALTNPTPQAFAALALKYPSQREAVKQSWDGLSAADQKAEGDTMARAYAAYVSGQPELAKQVVQDQITARKNSGLDTSHFDSYLSTMNTDPTRAQGAIGLILSQISDPKDFATKYSALQKLPGEVADQSATLDGKQADNTQKNLGIIGQTLGSLQGKNAKPEQAKAAIASLVASGAIPKEQRADWLASVPTDPKALDAWLGQQRAAGMKPDDQMKYTTPDANAKLQSETSIKTTGMNVEGQKAVQKMITDRQESKADVEANLDAPTLRSMAEQYVDGGDKSVMQNLGRGAQGAANIVALRAEITKVAKERGLSGSQIAAKLADYQGLTAGIRTSAQISARVENAISEAKELAPLAIKASEDLSRSGFLPFGKAQVMFNTQTNNPALKRFATANNGLVAAYAGAMARGQKPTQAMFDHAQQMLTEAQSHEAYVATVNQMYSEMAAASRAPQNVREHLRGEISGSGGASHDPAAAPAIPTGWTVREH